MESNLNPSHFQILTIDGFMLVNVKSHLIFLRDGIPNSYLPNTYICYENVLNSSACYESLLLTYKRWNVEYNKNKPIPKDNQCKIDKVVNSEKPHASIQGLLLELIIQRWIARWQVALCGTLRLLWCSVFLIIALSGCILGVIVKLSFAAVLLIFLSKVKRRFNWAAIFILQGQSS